MPTVGLRQIIFCGRSFVWVGDVVAQLGPYHFKLANASMLCRTGGVPWDVLIRGERRSEATYRYWGEVDVGPYFSHSKVWEGELPLTAPQE